MSLFWVLSIALLVFAGLLLLTPGFFVRRRLGQEAKAEFTEEQAERERQNIQIFEERESELDRQHAQGEIDEETLAALKLELEKTLLEDVAPKSSTSDKKITSDASNPKYWLGSAAMLVFVIVGSYLLYFQLGAYDKVQQVQAMQFDDTEMAAARTAADQGDMNALIDQLYQKLQSAPDNIEGWMLLSRSAMSMEDYSRAREGFSNILAAMNRQEAEIPPARKAAVLGMLAQAHYFEAGGRMTAKAQEVMEQALNIYPGESNALALKAMDAFESRDYQTALTAWQKLLQNSPDHPSRPAIEQGIARARSLLGDDAAAPSAVIATGTTADNQNNGVGVNVRVSLAPELAAQADPDDLVFVFARSDSGPPMPLAASRHRVAELPITVFLDDSKAMAPSARLSLVDRANIVARVSKSGQPVAQPGDFEGSMAGVDVRAGADIAIIIDEQL